MRLGALVIAGLALLVAGAAGRDPALPHYALEGKPTSEVHLDKAQREISGIAFTADGRLLAHGDERGIIYQIDFPGGRVVKLFAIGDASGPLVGDFEDIQVVGDRVFLVTSAGALVEAKLGADGATVPVVRRTRGLRGACEVEGMSWDATTSFMLLLCKEAKGKRWKDSVVILAVDPAT
ncbi:MAG TPA: hypothetical protein VJ277_14350, partial [Gemmatimonadales bacterium]|nr:hypothetical protein [Gemmatimonadales bacterium]